MYNLLSSMFTNARNNRFINTTFTINTNNFNSTTGLNILHNNVAPNAILNAGGRGDEARCHPGTRTEVIGLIDKWRLDIENNVTPNQLFWLSGPSGAGKTAIVQTMAEKWKSVEIPTANFFFFRADPSRRDARSFVSTLLYQMFDFFPAAREVVNRVLTLKPRILEAALEEQVDELICNTFRSIQQPVTQKIVLLIDGLDECDSDAKTSQTRILRILDQLVRQDDLPFLILVASRPEPHLSVAFGQLTSPVLSVFLGNQYSPEDDIRRFVTDEFEKIRTSHPHAALLQSNWPSRSDIDSIVRKSSGQFVYAATVVRFLAQSPAVPSLSLERVQGSVPCARNSPFGHLDAFYLYILRQADDTEAIHDILSLAILYQKITRKTSKFSSDAEVPPESWNRPGGFDAKDFCSYLNAGLPPIHIFLYWYNSRYTESLVMSCISEISAIIRFSNRRLMFYHASLSDFLLDQSRSDTFHVNIEEFTAKILPVVWGESWVAVDCEVPILMNGLLLKYIQHPTPAITNALLTMYPSNGDFCESYFDNCSFLHHISRLYYPHKIETYKQILKRWTTWAVSDKFDLDRHCGPRCWCESDGIPLLREHLDAARRQARSERR